jgi:hypothetical protein
MFRLEIANLGNIRSRYELLADDLADALIFQFFLDGASLHQRQVTETVPTALSSQRQTTEPAAVPTAPAPSVQPTSMARPVGQTFGFIGGLVDLLSSLVMILPRSVSGPLQNWLSQYRRVQSRVRQTQRVTQRVGRLASAGGVRSSSNVAVMSGGTGGALPAVTESNPTSAAPVQVVDGNGPAAVYEVGWTPPIEPGETLLVDLQIDPVKPYKHQHYPFRVTARSLESEAAPLIVEEGSISIQGLSWIRRFWLPVLVVILGVGVVSALVLFLLNNLGSWVL